MKTFAHATVTPQTTDTGAIAHWTHDVRMGRHALTADEPESAGGQNAGASPYQLLLASLGACTAMTLQMYADRKGWAIGAMQVKLSLAKDDDGADHIERSLKTDAELTDEQWDKLIEIASKTPVTKTLLAGAQIDTTRG